MPLTGHLGGRRHIRWLLWCGSSEDEPTAKGQGLGCGMGSHKRLQLGVFISAEGHRNLAQTYLLLFYTLSRPKYTGIGFMKWTSRTLINSAVAQEASRRSSS